jgi:hypothetical protein
MPVKVVKRGGKCRIVNAKTGKVDKTKNGKPRDGGGHTNCSKAYAQASFINGARKK